MREWQYYKNLGDVVTIIMGQSPSSDTYNDKEGLPFFQGNADFGKEHPTVRVFCNSPIRIAEPNDILISVRAPIGAINIADRQCCIGRGLAAIRGANSVSNRFLYFFLTASKNTLISQGTGSTFKSIGKDALKNLQMPVFNLNEQERIVSELDLLAGIIDKQKQQLKDLDTLAKSIFYDMFGNPVDNEKGWKTCRLESIIQVKGRVGWKGYKKEDLRDSGALAIGGGHLTNSGEIDLSEPVYLSMEKYEESPEIMIETGDLILVQRGTIGKVGLVRTDIGQATINPCVLILRPKTINNVYALHFFLNSNMQEHLKTLIRGVAQPMITQQQVNSLCVPIPPSEQQEVFAQRVQAIESQKQSINRSIAESQKLFDYTMDKYFG